MVCVNLLLTKYRQRIWQWELWLASQLAHCEIDICERNLQSVIQLENYASFVSKMKRITQTLTGFLKLATELEKNIASIACSAINDKAQIDIRVFQGKIVDRGAKQVQFRVPESCKEDRVSVRVVLSTLHSKGQRTLACPNLVYHVLNAIAQRESVEKWIFINFKRQWKKHPHLSIISLGFGCSFLNRSMISRDAGSKR